jgi:adenosylhomocysteine nucleosidase
MPVNSRALPDANLTPCHVGIVFAIPLEAEPLERRLTGLIAIQNGKFTARQGGWKGKAVVVVRSGVGRENAAAATDSLILGHRPRWVVSAGLAGGLRADLKRNDVVMANAILGDRGQRLSIDLRLSSPSTSGGSDSHEFHVGPLLTIDQVAFKRDQKRELAEATGAIAVDMETLAVAEVCQREQQRFLAVRAICDTIDDELPADVERLVRKKTLARRIGAAAGTIIRRPSTVKDLWRFREAAIVASQRLAKFLEGVIEQLD